MRIVLILSAVFATVLVSCKSENKSGQTNQMESVSKENITSETAPAKESAASKDTLILDNGIRITWLKKGTGESVSPGEVVLLDYEVRLENGEVVESSKKVNKPFPFLVGYQMQTIGWDLVLEQLSVGDKVNAFLPSALARGEKGIKGLIPPNANNIITLEVREKVEPRRKVDGNTVWVLDENPKNKPQFTDSNTISFHSITGTAKNPRYFNSFRLNQPFQMKTSDAGVVPGLKQGLLGAKKADRLYILVPPENGYGAKGFQNLVGPNESIFYNVYVMEVF